MPPSRSRTRNFTPPDRPQPRYEPKNRKNPTDDEEKILRHGSETTDAYLTFSFRQLSGKQKHRFVRSLFQLSRRMSAELFEKAVSRALSYRITDPDTLYRIAVLMLKEAHYQSPLVYFDEAFTNRPSFLEGRFTDKVDLTLYTDMGEDEDGSGTDQDA